MVLFHIFLSCLFISQQLQGDNNKGAYRLAFKREESVERQGRRWIESKVRQRKKERTTATAGKETDSTNSSLKEASIFPEHCKHHLFACLID
jgi:uncharacterized protein (UPF0332 family)